MIDEKKPMGRPPERLLVRVTMKRGLGTLAEVADITWPKNWPLPQAGDMVHLAPDQWGFVDRLTFNLEIGRIIIETR